MQSGSSLPLHLFWLYLLKSSTAAQIAIATRSLYEGQSQLGPTIATKLFARLNPLPTQTDLQNYDFSERGLEILDLIGVGKTIGKLPWSYTLPKELLKTMSARFSVSLTCAIAPKSHYGYNRIFR